MSKRSKPQRWLKNFALKQLPQGFLELMTRYFRLEVVGIENLPAQGPVIVAPNHSGYSGLDAMILAHQIRKLTGRTVGVLTHPLWYTTTWTGRPAKVLGFIEASLSNGLKVLEKGQILVIFPEAEIGNFKPTTEAYQLQEFRRGFIRMALLKQAPIVPTLILGAEESHLNLRRLSLPFLKKEISLPLPLVPIPLPARWSIEFLPARRLPYNAEAAHDQDLVLELAEDLREDMQLALNRALQQRKNVFL